MLPKAIGLSLALVTLTASAGNPGGIQRGAHGMGAYDHARLPEQTLGSGELRWEARQQTMERILYFERELQYEHSIARRCQERFPASTKILLKCIRRLAGKS